MPTPSEIAARIEQLEKILASGIESDAHTDKRVGFRPQADLERELARLQGLLNGTKARRVSYLRPVDGRS
jgi:hypothetical protein